MKKKLQLIKICLIGDIMLNNSWADANNKRNLFSNDIIKFIQNSDCKFLNLECTIKGKEENLLKNPRIHTSVDGIRRLNELKPTAVTIGNNHVYDNKEEGLIKVIEELEDLNIPAFGFSIDGKKNEFCFHKKMKSYSIKILSYVDEETNPNLPEDATVSIRYLNEKNLIEDLTINKKKENEIIVTSFHWGFDNHILPSPKQRKLARLAIDLGADIVWGHHPHIIQPIEYHKNRLIIYCQGNNCADNLPNRILNKFQKTSFLVSVSFCPEKSNNHLKCSFIKLYRTLGSSTAQIIRKNYVPFQIKGYFKINFFYNVIYKIAILAFYIRKTKLFLFRPGSSPLKQLLSLINRL